MIPGELRITERDGEILVRIDPPPEWPYRLEFEQGDYGDGRQWYRAWKVYPDGSRKLIPAGRSYSI